MADMKLFGDTATQILAECPTCGRVLKLDRFAVALEPVDGGYLVPATVVCPCGNTADAVLRTAPSGPSRGGASPSAVRCAKCGSGQYSADKKGFGLGKAAAGGLLLGPLGLLGGFFGSNKTQVTCLKCGYRWYPAG